MRFIAYSLLLGCLSIAPAWSACPGTNSVSLNQVTFKLNAEQWVATKTALVSIGVNASVSASALASIQNDMVTKLNKLAPGEWHIVSFDRSLDQSGLEKIQMLAQARLPVNTLPNLRDQSKAMSRPGETFVLADIQFTPSEEELRAANAALRTNIYQQIKEELVRVSKVYPEQKFYMHEINFVNDIEPPRPVAMTTAFMQRNKDQSDTLSVSDKVTLSATVVLAVSSEQCLTKMMP